MSRERQQLLVGWAQAIVPALLLFLGFHWSLGQTVAVLVEKVDNNSGYIKELKADIQILKKDTLTNKLKIVGLERGLQ